MGRSRAPGEHSAPGAPPLSFRPFRSLPASKDPRKNDGVPEILDVIRLQLPLSRTVMQNMKAPQNIKESMW